MSSLSSAQQRHARRFRVDEPIRIRVLGNTETTSDGRIKDFSETGLGLIADQPVPVFADVLVEYRGLFLPGSIAYCLPADGGGFRVGLQLEELPAIQSGLLELSSHVVEPPPLFPTNKPKP